MMLQTFSCGISLSWDKQEQARLALDVVYRTRKGSSAFDVYISTKSLVPKKRPYIIPSLLPDTLFMMLTEKEKESERWIRKEELKCHRPPSNLQVECSPSVNTIIHSCLHAYRLVCVCVW